MPRPPAVPIRPPSDGQPLRPLVVTSDPDVLDELLRLAAAAGVELDVAADAATARRAWPSAPFVVVASDAVRSVRRGRLPRRAGVALLGRDLDDADVWERGVQIGAEHVVFLPDAEPWLTDRLADAVEGSGPEAPIVAVIGGRGGAGATTLACALGVTASRAGRQSVLVDTDPLGGGIDLVFGAEAEGGLRWPGLARTSGRLPAGALAAALPSLSGLAVLSWDRAQPEPLSPDAVASVLSAARRAHELVVVDLPRALDDTSRLVLSLATTVLLVVPNEVRAAAAAGRVAAGIGLLCADLRVVTRGPAPSGLTGAQVCAALGLPLQGDLRPEGGIDVALERGEPPGRRGRGALSALCTELLDELLPSLGRAA